MRASAQRARWWSFSPATSRSCFAFGHSLAMLVGPHAARKTIAIGHRLESSASQHHRAGGSRVEIGGAANGEYCARCELIAWVPASARDNKLVCACVGLRARVCAAPQCLRECGVASIRFVCTRAKSDCSTLERCVHVRSLGARARTAKRRRREESSSRHE